jgi:predicted transcriptional regulator
MTVERKDRIEENMGDDFMTVILSYGNIKRSILELTKMMLEKEMDHDDIIEYVKDLVEEAVTENLKYIQD